MSAKIHIHPNRSNGEHELVVLINRHKAEPKDWFTVTVQLQNKETKKADTSSVVFFPSMTELELAQAFPDAIWG